MSAAPLVSVVMSVFNDEKHLESTLKSVLSQTGVDFELVAIDDGSTDQTGAILDEYAAATPCLRVVHQENSGLTRALIHGCDLAKGKYIARQDSGDISLPGRLSAQSAFLDSRPDVVLTSCGTRYLGPEGEELYDLLQEGDVFQQGLQQLRLDRVRGPSHHGSTMFRNTAYQAVGGYRAAFPVAQDLDLWLRLAEHGNCLASSEIYYHALCSPGAISFNLRRQQLKVAKEALRLAHRRRNGLEEGPISVELSLQGLKNLRQRSLESRLKRARFYYFIGSILQDKQPALSRKYLKMALKTWVLYPRALYRLAQTKARP